MKNNAIITAVGKDQPGIVAGVTKVLFEQGCNLEDSSMTILEGEFAVILVISLPKDLGLDVLNKSFDVVRRDLHVEVFLKAMHEEETKRQVKQEQSYMISVYGADRPGIVYQVARLLSDHQVNITDVNTKINEQASPPTYMMLLEVCISSQELFLKIQKELESLAHQIAVRATIHPIDTLVL